MKTKFDIGDIVWFIRDNKPKSDRITDITIYGNKKIIYNTNLNKNLAEEDLYKTGKAAVESLLKLIDGKSDDKEQMILS